MTAAGELSVEYLFGRGDWGSGLVSLVFTFSLVVHVAGCVARKIVSGL